MYQNMPRVEKPVLEQLLTYYRTEPSLGNKLLENVNTAAASQITSIKNISEATLRDFIGNNFGGDSPEILQRILMITKFHLIISDASSYKVNVTVTNQIRAMIRAKHKAKLDMLAIAPANSVFDWKKHLVNNDEYFRYLLTTDTYSVEGLTLLELQAVLTETISLLKTNRNFPATVAYLTTQTPKANAEVLGSMLFDTMIKPFRDGLHAPKENKYIEDNASSPSRCLEGRDFYRYSNEKMALEPIAVAPELKEYLLAKNKLIEKIDLILVENKTITHKNFGLSKNIRDILLELQKTPLTAEQIDNLHTRLNLVIARLGIELRRNSRPDEANQLFEIAFGAYQDNGYSGMFKEESSYPDAVMQKQAQELFNKLVAVKDNLVGILRTGAATRPLPREIQTYLATEQPNLGLSVSAVIDQIAANADEQEAKRRFLGTIIKLRLDLQNIELLDAMIKENGDKGLPVDRSFMELRDAMLESFKNHCTKLAGKISPAHRKPFLVAATIDAKRTKQKAEIKKATQEIQFGSVDRREVINDIFDLIAANIHDIELIALKPKLRSAKRCNDELILKVDALLLEIDAAAVITDELQAKYQNCMQLQKDSQASYQEMVNSMPKAKNAAAPT